MDDVPDLTMGVTTRSLRGVEGEQPRNDTTRPATQVSLRRVESCLGGHEAGVWGSTRGSRMHRSGYENGDDWPCQIVRPSVILQVLTMILSVRSSTNEQQETV